MPELDFEDEHLAELIKTRTILDGIRFRLSLALMLGLWICIEISVLTWHIVGGVFSNVSH